MMIRMVLHIMNEVTDYVKETDSDGLDEVGEVVGGDVGGVDDDDHNEVGVVVGEDVEETDDDALNEVGEVVGEHVRGFDYDDLDEVGEVVGGDVGGAGLWHESDPINLVHTCPQNQQEPA